MTNFNVSQETARLNPMIIGPSRTGKTIDRLFPLFKEWTKGKLLIDTKQAFDHSSEKNVQVYKEFLDGEAEKITEHLLNGGCAVLIISNILQIKEYSRVINDVFANIINANPEDEILICIDELTSFGRLEMLPSALKTKNLYIASTFQQQERLFSLYSEVEINSIIDTVNLVKVTLERD